MGNKYTNIGNSYQITVRQSPNKRRSYRNSGVTGDFYSALPLDIPELRFETIDEEMVNIEMSETDLVHLDTRLGELDTMRRFLRENPQFDHEYHKWETMDILRNL